jgi:hypothetical protein
VRQAAAACSVSRPLCGGGSRWGCSLSRRGHSSNCTRSVISATPRGVVVALGLLFGASRLPTAQRGIYALWRKTAQVLSASAFRVFTVA